MNVFLIEDEELAVRKLTKLLLDVDPTINIVGTSASVRSAVAWLNANGPGQPSAPDLILMDIELADGQSFEIFEQTTVSAPVIFTTSYDEYALRAFKVNSIDYLLKPIKRHELEASLTKYKRTVADNGEPVEPKPSDINVMDIDALVQQLRQQIQPADYRRRFLVKHRQQWVPIEVSDIAYFYSEEGVSLFRTHSNQKYSLDYPLDELEKMLDPTQFFRANRQYIVQINTIQQIHPYFNNKLKLVLKPAADDEVLVSRERAADFKKWMGK
ncbi:LytTR family DNA-binding domain-containing protein [Spirosoma sp. RP8]|uniref:LytTR family DNA-binding domain-containing protein n=1 Tax=Spirosoma liriopis TaxID=2937440 RepID=A0ABT0HH07_9BACT|nr:LytTR family DNA-binding domain-containing protein [Spirosoma liriopis]MCK8491152.1 LytTR family DNA-binding domain-containing protein [Spirosoma liriopis]